MNTIRGKLTLSYLGLAAITLAITGSLLLLSTHFLARELETASLHDRAAKVLSAVGLAASTESDPQRVSQLLQLAESIGDFEVHFVGPDDRNAPPRPAARVTDDPDIQGAIESIMRVDPRIIRNADNLRRDNGSVRLGTGVRLPMPARAGMRPEMGPGMSPAPSSEPTGYFEIVSRNSTRDDLMRITIIGFIVSAIVTLGASAGIGLAVSNGLTRPIRRLTTTVARMEGGDLDARAEIETGDEIGTLAGRINSMADRLDATMHSLRDERDSTKAFLADASHELRTPITAMTTFVELLQQQSPEETRELLGEIEAQNARMARIVGDLLFLSRLDSGVSAAEPQEIGVADLLREAWSSASADPGAAGIEFRVQHAAGTMVRGTRVHLLTLFENLFTNAIHVLAADPDVEAPNIVCSVEPAGSSGGTITIRVTDNGPGISAEHLPHLFERFYRPPRSAAGGSGLGLAIARSIAREHGGTIEAESPPSGATRGARFTVTLVSDRG